MRNLAKKEALQKAAADALVTIAILPLDVSSAASIQQCIDTIIAKENRIDILINNAGAGFLKASELATEAELMQVTDTNYLGVVRCTNAVLPFMRQQKQGHIINISSVGGLVGQPFNELYCAAKFAVEGYTEAMATYLTPNFGIQFTIVEPGGISTEFVNNVFKHLAADKPVEDNPYTPILNTYIAGIQNRSKEDIARIYQTGEQVAEVILQVLASENPPLRIRTSAWANEFCALKTQADPDGLLLAKRLQKAYFG
jgi:NAD(P)-dependent dehydrogenase (short-subunit alcohol dehydrogenase family)